MRDARTLRGPLSFLVAAVAATLLAACGSDGSGEGPDAGPDTTSDAAELVAFESCDDLLGTLASFPAALAGEQATLLSDLSARQAAPALEAADAGAAGDAAEAAPTTSEAVGSSDTGSNIQEAGVDEPDIVKTDGELIYAIRGTELFVVSAGERPEVVAAFELPGEGIGFGSPEILLYEDRVLALTQRERMRPSYRLQTVLLEIDVSDPAAPEVERRMILDGSYLSARLTGSTVRVALNSRPDYPITLPEPNPTSTATEPRVGEIEAGAADRSDQWLPQAIVRDDGDRSEDGLLGCTEVRAPAEFAGAGMISVSTIDLDRGLEVVDSDAVMADGDTVYASADSLYVATGRWAPVTLAGDVVLPPAVEPEIGIVAPEPSTPRTEVHRFDTAADGATEYVASGSVEGRLLNRFAMSEHEGDLRIATTIERIGPADGIESESAVTILRPDDGKLRRLGRVDGLGEGEEIRAVRFVGELGFVVTFRQIDPLYTLDLSDPENPEELGELKIPGYSAYLHPVGEDRLLGVGQDADQQGRTLGAQLSLFDVSDLTDPERVDQLDAGRQTSSPVEFDPLAFTYWPEQRLALVPIDGSGPGVPRAVGSSSVEPDIDPREIAPKPVLSRVLVAEVGDGGSLEESGSLIQPGGNSGAPIQRTIILGERVYIYTSDGISSHDPAGQPAGESSFAAFGS